MSYCGIPFLPFFTKFTAQIMKKILTILSIACLFSCGKEQSEEKSNKIFHSLPSSETGVTFENRLTVNDSMNYFSYGYFYMGGGVAIADFNNDGLQDLYFTGNMVNNKLYLNQGEWKFKDATTPSGTGSSEGLWVTGCSVIDINTDGLLDIYVSVAGKWASRKNILFVNQGNDADGNPIFKDEAEKRGLADEGYSIQTTFLDYDQDGDIDVLVANYQPTPFASKVNDYKKLTQNVTWDQSDHLYENDGTGHFRDVTEKAGLINYGLTVGVIASDFNNDGYTDIYFSNDFNTPDKFYINNGNGTFSNHIETAMMHTSFYGMGVDAGDINGDGLLDLVQVDMTPKDNFRNKANMSSMDIQGFWDMVDAGFHYQYMFNTLQVSQGINPDGVPFYGEMAKINGIDKTDWSWSCLFADYDNDGYKDLYITNGTRRDINNRDYFNWLERTDISLKVKYRELSPMDLTEKMPYKRVDNYIFRNGPDHVFKKANKEWGLHFEGFSNGAAYGDLDNDGDLDLVVNNIDSVASIFENKSSQVKENQYLRIRLQGPKLNPLGLGTKIFIKTNQQEIYHEHTMVRGYESSMEPFVHVGLGSAEILKMTVVWPDGATQEFEGISSNQTFTVDYKNAAQSTNGIQLVNSKENLPMFDQQDLIQYAHAENDFDDYQREILLPHQMSRFGPALAKGDLNNDGLDDLYVGAAFGKQGVLFVQLSDGNFKEMPLGNTKIESGHEDLAAAFFDANNDGFVDLYVVSGGNEFEAGHDAYQDRLYLNNGEGELLLAPEKLPAIGISGGTVQPADFDQDGDTDLFIGGRQLPGQYPMPTSSLLLVNGGKENGYQFTDMSAEIAPEMQDLGMVTDAIWDDYDEDNDLDLIVVGEWMPVTIFENDDNEFRKVVPFENNVGWWFSIEKGDLDGDGDNDYLVGNLGTNYKYQASIEETFDVYSYDFDQNGKLDIVLSYYQDGTQFPVRGKSCSSEQIPVLKKKYSTYNKFASSDLGQIYTPELLDESLHYKAHTFASVAIFNGPKKAFEIKPLPTQVQASSINDFVIEDVNGDGNLDVVCGGNLFVSEIETPRNDACFGWLMLGDGNGGLRYVSNYQTGFYVPYDIKAIESIKTNNGSHILFANNSGPIVSYIRN